MINIPEDVYQSFKKHGVDLYKMTMEEILDYVRRDLQKHYFYYEPHPKQALFHAAGQAAKERLFLAGNRTGKTFCACVEVVMHLTGNYPDWWNGYKYTHPVDVWVASNTGQTTRDILQYPYYLGQAGKPGLIPNELIQRITKVSGLPDTVDTVHVLHKSGGISTLGFKSYDQGRTKFQGTKKHIIHFDEEPSRAVYQEALMRTMSTGDDHHGMILLTMTPLMGMTEMVQHFMEERIAETIQDKKFYLQASWGDNPYLSLEEQKTILGALKPHERDAREKGTPALGIGLVYPVVESKIVVDPFEIPNWWPRVFGMDFGWSNPTAALFAAHDRDNDILYCYGEYAQREKTPEQHALQMIRQGASWIPGVYDPAGKISAQKDGDNLVRLYREAGIRTLVKADNSKEKGIMKVLQRMQNGGLKIVSTLSKTLAEFRGYARDEAGIPKKNNDHLMDCMRYIVMSGLSIARARQGSFQSSPPVQPHGWMGL